MRLMTETQRSGESGAVNRKIKTEVKDFLFSSKNFTLTVKHGGRRATVGGCFLASGID